jgi:peptide/nickel transport system permease protein
MSAAAQPSRGHLPKSVRAAQSVATTGPATAAPAPYRREVLMPEIAAPARTQRQQVWDSFRSHHAAFISLCVLATMVVICIFAPFVLQEPEAIDMKILAAEGPSAQHLFGTDQLGRDILSRLINAGRTSLAIGFVVAFGAAAIGACVGVMAGYFGGRVDGVLMWFVNVLMTIPSLPLLMSVAVLVASPSSALGPVVKGIPEWFRIAAVLALLGWMGISRVVRSQVVSLRGQEFVEAAHALGGSHARIMFVHILPNCVSVIAVFTTLAVSGAIIGESALSFLGLGVSPPTATWGNMLAEARDLFAIMNYWWTVWFPALAIFITVLSVNFIGDGVRDALDPKSMKK